MANAIEVSNNQPGPESTSRLTGWPHSPMAPGWMGWAPQAAVAWALAYGAVRVWWAIHGTPWFGPLHIDLFLFSGWSAVGICAAAVVVALALRVMAWRWRLFVAGWAVCVALLISCPLLLLDAVGGLLPGLGVQFYPYAFLSRAACLVAGILVGASTVAYRRQWRSACMFCGRSVNRARVLRAPKWAWWAAYAAVAGCLVRLGAQVAIGFGMIPRPAGGIRLAIESLEFESAFLLAGVVLPLSLVHSWGRIVPHWVPMLACRRVPRWLPLGPELVIGGLMTTYFGFTLVKVATDTFTGAWHQSLGSFPLAFFWVAVPGYLAWGLGLFVASLAYNRLTRPPCRVCGRQ